MRPVDKGTSPKVTYQHYKHAATDLINRIGNYCCYCERRIETHLAVEHIKPKSIHPLLEKKWNNFLLGCSNCNSCKGDTPIKLEDYLWPDNDNTLLAIVYDRQFVKASSANLQHITSKAEALIKLVGLDKDPGQPDKKRRPLKKDSRWQFRDNCWGLAQLAYKRLTENDCIALREQIVDTATSRGGFGIWYTIFKNDKDMVRRFNAAFPNTATSCFDPDFNLAPRPGGQI